MTIDVSKLNYGVVAGPEGLVATKLNYGVVVGPAGLTATKITYGVVIDPSTPGPIGVVSRRRQMMVS